MSRPKPPVSVIKPSEKTRFHVDYDWWQKSSQDLRLTLQQICNEYGVELSTQDDPDSLIDWIDPLTGMVRQVDPVMYQFLVKCASQPDYITDRTSLIEAVFRALLGAANCPLSAKELSMRTGRPVSNILGTLSGRSIYKGIRPYVYEGKD